MRKLILSMTIVLVVASASLAAPVPPAAKLWTANFSVLNTRYFHDAATGDFVMEFRGSQRVGVLTDENNGQTVHTDASGNIQLLEVLLLTTFSTGSVDPTTGQATAAFVQGNLEVYYEDALTSARTDYLKATLGTMNVETTVTLPQELVVAQAPFSVDSALGTWDNTVGKLGLIHILDWKFAPGDGVDDFRVDEFANAVSNIQIVFIPEPATMTLLALGGVAILKRRRK